MSMKNRLKAQAVKYTEAEKQEIIRGKQRDFIHRQEEFCKVYHARVYKQEEIKHMEKHMEERTSTEIGYLGYVYPMSMFQARIKYEHFNNYRPLVEHEKSLREALKKDGFTEEQLLEVINGRLFKELPK